MELAKAKEIGLFGRRVYIGDLVAEKKLHDFKDAKEYGAYLDRERMKEFIDLREPRNDEIRKAQPLGRDYYTEAPEQVKLARFQEYDEKQKTVESEMGELVLACIVGSSFTADNKKVQNEEVAEFVKSKLSIYTRLLSEWVEMAKGFQQPNSET